MLIASAQYQHASTLQTACIRIQHHKAKYIVTVDMHEEEDDSQVRTFTVSSEKAARALGAALHVELKCAHGLRCVSEKAA